MKALLKKIWGFRSGTPWKMILATLYYLMALSVLWFGATTPIPVAAGTRDVIVYGASVFVIFMTIPFRCAARHKRGRNAEPLTQHYKIC